MAPTTTTEALIDDPPRPEPAKRRGSVASLVGPLAALGMVEGWLLLEGTNTGFEYEGRPGAMRQWVVSTVAFLLVGAALGAIAARGSASVARFVLASLALTTAAFVAMGFGEGPLLPESLLVMGILGTLVLPLHAAPFAAWRAARSRRGSVLGRAEARGVWVAACVIIAFATALVSHGRAFLFDDAVGRSRLSHVGSNVELAVLYLVALVAVAIAIRDAAEARRVARIAATALAPGAVGDAVIDLGIGDETQREILAAGASYRAPTLARVIVGDPHRARRALRVRVGFDLAALLVIAVANGAFKPVVDPMSRHTFSSFVPVTSR